MKSLLGFCIIIILLAGCSTRDSEYDKRLDHAEELIDSMPQAVADILDSVPATELDERNSHRIALLRARLQYEGDSLPESDSVIAATAEYFRNNGDRLLLMQSLFIRSRILYSNGEYVEAMKLACTGADLAEEFELPVWQGRFAQHEALLFSTTGDFPNSASYGMTASRAYARAKSASNRYRSLFAALDAAADYVNMMDYKRSLSIIDSVERLIPGNSAMDSSLKRYSIQLKIPAELHTNHPRKALDLIRQIKTYSYYRPTQSYILLEARALMSLDSFERAKPLVEYAGHCAASPMERLDYFESLKFIAINQGDVRMIDACNDSVNILNAAIEKTQFDNNLSKTFQNIIKENAQAKLNAAHNEAIIYVTIAILVSCLLAISLFVIIRRKREISRKDKELTQKQEELRQNQQELDNSQKELGNMHKKLDDTQEELDCIQKELDDREKELDNSQKKLKQNKEELKAKDNELQSTMENLKATHEQLQSSRDDLSAAQTELTESKKNMKLIIENASEKEQEIIELSSNLDKTLEKVAEFKEHCSVLHILGKSALNNIINEYEFKKGNEKMSKQILAKLETEIEKLYNPETFEEIEYLMNFLHDNVIQLLRKEFPEMAEIDIRILTLNLAGWSPRPIARFLGISKESCSTKKSRLINRIRKSSAPNRKLFIDKFYYKPDGISPEDKTEQ